MVFFVFVGFLSICYSKIMKVSTLIIVSIPIVLGLQIKDTVGTTTENTFWYQLFGTPSRSQPAAGSRSRYKVQGFTPISTSSSSSSSSSLVSRIIGVGRTYIRSSHNSIKNINNNTTSNPIAHYFNS